MADQVETLTLNVVLNDMAAGQLPKLKQAMQEVETGSREHRDRFKRDLDEIQAKLMGGMGVKKFVEDMGLVGRTLKGLTGDSTESLSGMQKLGLGVAAFGVGAGVAIEAMLKLAEGLKSIVDEARSVKLTAGSLGLDPAQFEKTRIAVEIMGGSVEQLAASMANLGKAAEELHKPGGGMLKFELIRRTMSRESAEAMEQLVNKIRDAKDPYERLAAVIEARQNVINNAIKRGVDLQTAATRGNELAAKFGVDPVTAQLKPDQMKEIIELSRQERDEINKSLEARARASRAITSGETKLKETTGDIVGDVLDWL
jgi:hypothetical protein